jgi:hypothetical protein
VSALSKLKPIAKARRNALRSRGGGWQISRALEEAIFRHADVLSEGGARVAPTGHSTYFGSTMISVELSKLAAHGSGLTGAALLGPLQDAIDGSVRVRLRAMRLARAEAARRVHRRTLGTLLCEIVVRIHGKHLHIDVDLEVPLRVSSRTSRSG